MLEHLFSMALHQSLINIFVAFWNPFLMSFVGVIVGVSFDNPSVHPYLPDGVHVNSFGQYCLYRSYRGTILKALRMLSS